MNTSKQILELILKTIDEKKILKQDCINACGLSSTFFSDWKAGRFKSPSYEKIIKIEIRSVIRKQTSSVERFSLKTIEMKTLFSDSAPS